MTKAPKADAPARRFGAPRAASVLKVEDVRVTAPDLARRAVLENIGLETVRSNGYSFQIEMTHRAWLGGFRVAEVPIVFEERRSGTSKMSGHIVREAVLMVVKIYLCAGLRRHPRGVHPLSVAAGRNKA